MTSAVNDENASVFVLPAVLDLTTADSLHHTLLDRIRTGDPLVLAGAAVERISTAVVQVLLAAEAEARSRGNPLQLRDPSPALAEALVDLGVASHLGR